MSQRTILGSGVAFLLGLATLRVSSPVSSQNQPPGVDPPRLVQFLNGTIAWYRQLGTEQQLVSDANDAIFVSGNRQTADEIVRLVFQFARAQEQAQASNASQGKANAPAPGSAFASLAQQETKAEQQAAQVEGEVEDLRKKIASAPPSRRKELESQLAETQAEVDLAKARAEAIQNMAQFVSSATTSTNGLGAEIDAIASTLPPELTQPSTSGTTPPTSSPQANNSSSLAAGTGLWEQGARLFSTMSKLRTINDISSQTQALSRNLQEIRSPLSSQLRQLTQHGDQLSHEADTATPATLEQEKSQLDALTQQFKQLTAASAPIAKTAILLGLYQANLANWHSAVVSQLLRQTRSLVVRILILAIIIAALLGGSELWRRAIYRYVRDVRRRSQLHWVRKLATWFAIAVIVGLAFASQMGSVATFAGLLTAGIAVALQNVIQSVVGYFFLIGKYGIRAGDHVQIGGVTGEVIEVGLVRIHLMEMGGSAENSPTGRVVAFSNSIVFQATPGLFKQIPGANFAWHEITLTLPANTNFVSARERLMKAVEAGLSPYKDEIAKQHSAMEDSFEIAGAGLAPSVQLQFTASGVEAKVRYPVALRHSIEIDESVTRSLLSDLDLAHSDTPAIRMKTTPA